MNSRKQLNRYTQRELEVIIGALENFHPEYTPFCAAKPLALAKSKLRLRREKERAK